jgi:hypothetical protein
MTKKKKAGRPKEFDSEMHVHLNKKMREEFLVLCTTNKPRTTMNHAIRHFMKLCIVNKTILGLTVEK